MFSQAKVIWSLMSGQRLRYGLALLCLAAATLLNYLTPLVGTAAIDHAISGGRSASGEPAIVGWILVLLGGAARLRAHLWLAPVAMVALAVASGLVSYLKGWQTALASDGIARGLKDTLYDHINHLPASRLDRLDSGDLVQRCSSDVETVRMFFSGQVMDIGNSVILAATAFPLLLSLSRPMTLVSFTLIVPIVAYSYIYFRRVKHVFLEVEKAESEVTDIVQENLTGIRVVRAFARQDFEREKFAGPNRRYRDRTLRLLRLMSWYWSISDLVALSQIGLTLVVGARWIAEGRLTVGVLFAFLAYLGMMLWPVRQMGRVLTDLGKTSVAMTRIREILLMPREAEPAAPFLPLDRPFSGRIVVRDLCFSHAGPASAAGGRGALDGVSFELRPGETLAILGPSGSGKSTLAHILLRLYDYDRGSVQFDGRELSSLPRRWVRSQIGTVMQEPFLFSKSVRDNLLLGGGDAPDHEVEAAARAAGIHDTILSFEHGYGTLVGERGITLSGGQRQRVAIARAILKRPPLLILDDALSAIDGETEALILGALRERRGRAGTILIAHRLSTVAHADRVIVLERGRIVQSGTHAELAARDGLYRRLWQIQTSVEAELQDELSTG
jgi:ATP-binding cassette subfamily B protein